MTLGGYTHTWLGPLRKAQAPMYLHTIPCPMAVYERIGGERFLSGGVRQLKFLPRSFLISITNDLHCMGILPIRHTDICIIMQSCKSHRNDIIDSTTRECMLLCPNEDWHRKKHCCVSQPRAFKPGHCVQPSIYGKRDEYKG